MNADELLKILSKQWCNTNDLIKITGLCKNNVLKLKKEIMSHLKGKNYSLPNWLIPMSEVVKYLQINIEYLKEVSKNTGETTNHDDN